MRLHNEGRREVATLRSMCCVCILSAFLPTRPDVVFLGIYVCVMNETGAFFSSPAFLFGERINKAPIQNGGWRLTVSFPLSTPFPLTRGWALF